MVISDILICVIISAVGSLVITNLIKHKITRKINSTQE